VNETEPPAPQPAPTESPIIAELQRAADGVRSAAKWLAASFGAIGAVLVAGSQFSTIGRLSWHNARLYVALAGVAIALWAVARVLWILFDVMMPSQMSLSTLAGESGRVLRNYLDERPEALLGFSDLSSLDRDYRRALEDRLRTYLAYCDLVLETGDEKAAGVKEAMGKAIAADAKLNVIDSTVGYVVKLVSVEQLRNLLQNNKWGIFRAAVLVAVGIGVFAWAANPEEKKQSPAATTVHLRNAHLEGAQLSLAQLTGADLHGAHLERAVLVGANLAGADLSGSYLVAANLRGGDLRRAKLQDVTWGDTTCPDGTTSNAHEDGCASHRSPK
jgi:hypothetical protein